MSALIRYRRPSYTLSNLLNDYFNDDFFRSSREISRTNWPLVDIVENEDNFVLKADVPGLDKKDIKISVEDNVLSISGEKKQEKKDKQKGRYNFYERSYGSFQRSFALPENIDEKSINANLKNGLLELTLKKVEKPKPKAIEIKVD